MTRQVLRGTRQWRREIYGTEFGPSTAWKCLSATCVPSVDPEFRCKGAALESSLWIDDVLLSNFVALP
jgi:hypothetical protein